MRHVYHNAARHLRNAVRRLFMKHLHVHTHFHLPACDCSPRRPKLRLLTVGPVTEQNLPGPERTELNMTVVLTDTQNTNLTFGSPKDKKGADAEVQTLEFVSSDPTVATFVQSADGGFKGDVSAGLPGVTEVYLRADADLGDGVEVLESERVVIQVTGGKAVAFGSPVQGEVTEQP